MSETNTEWWARIANRGIVGLGDDGEGLEGNWPSEGYDGSLHACKWHEYPGGVYTNENRREITDIFVQSGHTREEWVELADAMIGRWQRWREWIATVDPEERAP